MRFIPLTVALALLIGCTRVSGRERTSATARSVLATFSQGPDSAGERMYRAANQRFLLVGERASDPGVVLQETSIVRCCVNGERTAARDIVLRGWAQNLALNRPPDWTDSLRADAGDLRDYRGVPLYRATLHGCCDSGDLLTFINPVSGQRRFFLSAYGTAQSHELSSVFDRSGQAVRFIAFHDIYTEVDPPESIGRKDVVGVIQYGPADGSTQRAVLYRSDGAASDYRLQSIGVLEHDSIATEVELPYEDQARVATDQFDNFLIGVSLFGMGPPSVRVAVPVSHDKLDLAHAALPAGFRIDDVSQRPRANER